MKAPSSSSSSSSRATINTPHPPSRIWRWPLPMLVVIFAALMATMSTSFRNVIPNSLPAILSSKASPILLAFIAGLVVCVGVACFPIDALPFGGNSFVQDKEAKVRNTDPKDEKDPDDDDAFVVPPVRIKDSVQTTDDGNVTATPLVLTTDLAHKVAEIVLPTEISDYTWIRVYSLSRDGDSFVTFLKAVETLECTLLVLRTQRGSVVGAFADASWTKAAQGPTKFHGGPKCRLFRVCGDDATDCRPTKSRVECYKWTGTNNYCQLCDVRRRRIAFGGGTSEGSKGSSSFGLTLERDFLEGTTAPCPTFNNPPLCEESFAILELEVFGFRLW